MKKLRWEMRCAVYLFVFATLLRYFLLSSEIAPLANAAHFIIGASIGLGLVGLVVGLLPQESYDRLFYKRFNRKK